MINLVPRALTNITKAEGDTDSNIDHGRGHMGSPYRPAANVRKTDTAAPSNLDCGLGTMNGPTRVHPAPFRQTHRGLEADDQQAYEHAPGLFDDKFSSLNSNNAYHVRNPRIIQSAPIRSSLQKSERTPIKKFVMQSDEGLDLTKLW